MPDLNELLRWSIANTPTPQPNATEPSSGSGELALRFNPNTTSSAGGSSALHPSDPQYRSSSTDAATPARREDLTTEMLDLIMGKSDSIIMKEKMAAATDESLTLDERVGALDDFEMLIELIDNANNMAILKLWEPLVGLLQSEHQPIVAHACWIIGTAVQNNLKAQAALYIFDVLPKILSIIYPPSSSPSSSSSSSSHRRAFTSTRAKATYAFSSAIKHWPLAHTALSSNTSQGYAVLRQGAQDSEPVIRRKFSFLIGTLVMQSGEKYEGELPGEVISLVEEHAKSQPAGTSGQSIVDGLRENGVLSSLLAELAKVPSADAEVADLEFEENSVKALSRAALKGGLSAEEKAILRGIWERWGESGRDERGLGGEDGEEVVKALA